MARYDLYRVAEDDAYLLDVQSNLLSHMTTRVVIPLLPPNVAPLPARRLNPNFAIGGKNYILVTQFMSALTASEMHASEGNLSGHHDEIVAAIDMLFQGF